MSTNRKILITSFFSFACVLVLGIIILFNRNMDSPETPSNNPGQPPVQTSQTQNTSKSPDQSDHDQAQNSIHQLDLNPDELFDQHEDNIQKYLSPLYTVGWDRVNKFSAKVQPVNLDGVPAFEITSDEIISAIKGKNQEFTFINRTISRKDGVDEVIDSKKHTINIVNSLDEGTIQASKIDKYIYNVMNSLINRMVILGFLQSRGVLPPPNKISKEYTVDGNKVKYTIRIGNNTYQPIIDISELCDNPGPEHFEEKANNLLFSLISNHVYSYIRKDPGVLEDNPILKEIFSKRHPLINDYMKALSDHLNTSVEMPKDFREYQNHSDALSRTR